MSSTVIFVIALLSWVCQIYLILLVCRAVLSWVEVVNPTWRPTNTVVLILANLLYSLTDPPLRLIGKYVKPLRFGGFGLDLSFIVLFLAVMVIQRALIQLAYL